MLSQSRGLGIYNTVPCYLREAYLHSPNQPLLASQMEAGTTRG
jgi:hypothetical protein